MEWKQMLDERGEEKEKEKGRGKKPLASPVRGQWRLVLGTGELLG
jgi:hypothetical protein